MYYCYYRYSTVYMTLYEINQKFNNRVTLACHVLPLPQRRGCRHSLHNILQSTVPCVLYIIQLSKYHIGKYIILIKFRQSGASIINYNITYCTENYSTYFLKSYPAAAAAAVPSAGELCVCCL